MIEWKIVDEKYLTYLRDNFEKRIPYSNYGANKYKPFFGQLFQVGALSYITQISSPKQRHYTLKNSLDFYKIYDPNNSTRLLGVINLNYMFPIKTTDLMTLNYRDIDNHRTFKNNHEKSQYINLLKKEMKQINKLNLEVKSQKLYYHVLANPTSKISTRCFDFKQLESACKSYPKSNT